MSKYTIFSIDNVTDLHVLAKFLRHFDTQVAMQKTKGTLLPVIGSYKGVLEQAFICTHSDFVVHVQSSKYVDGQESFLHLEDGHYGFVYGYLEYGDRKEHLGTVRVITQAEAMGLDAWTYRPDTNTYFVVE